MPRTCVLLKATAQQGRISKDVPCCGLEKNGMIGACYRHGMACVNQARPHCVNQVRMTHSKPLAASHGRGTALARHGNGMLCVNQPLIRQKLFLLRLNKNPSTALIQIALRLIVLEENSECTLDHGLHRYPELLIFVVFPYFRLLRTNIHTLSNFLLQPVIQKFQFSCYFPPYNDRNPFEGATVHLGFNILL